jgi:hypothetical protein
LRVSLGLGNTHRNRERNKDVDGNGGSKSVLLTESWEKLWEDLDD